MSADPLELAKKILDVIPMSMAKIRTEMRAASPSYLSVPQFRILANIFRGRNLAGEIAKHQGVSQPAMSKMIEALVEKGLVRRETEAGKDRRRVPLVLTEEGETLFLKIRRSAQQEISRSTARLGARQRQEMFRGLQRLESFFSAYPQVEGTKKGESRKP
jgi:DNA-binding MarR family transcriptional regulator